MPASSPSPSPGSSSARSAPEPRPLPTGFAPLEPHDPTTVGPFQLVGRIGAGGMGAVYGALDASGRHIAVKVIHPRFAHDPAYRAGFAREADLLSRVEAECAPELLGADTTSPLPWLATEFVQGDTLLRHTADHGPLTGPALTAFAAGTAEALAAVHGAGIVHRDVKPANVILGPGGPRLIDFGIARSVDDTAPEEGVYGTPGWMAPERLSGGLADAASDSFAWGCLVVHAATGHGPFGSGDTATLLQRTREGDLDVDGVPEELLPVVRRALSADPTERPATAEALEEVLELAAGISDAAEAGPLEPGGTRGRLRALLGAAWQGFGATGRGVGPWIAAAATLTASTTALAGAAAVGVAAGGGATSAAGATGAGAAAGAGTIAGMSKGVAIMAAGATAATVVTGSWVAGRTVTDQPLIPGTQAESSPSPSPSPSPSEPAHPQRVEFRTMTIGFPEDWNVERVEEDFRYVMSADPPEPEEWLAVFPAGGSCDMELTVMTVSTEGCEHIKILGPGAIETGGPGYVPVDEQTYFLPSTNVPPCPEGVELEPNGSEQGSYTPPEPELAPIGDLEAAYNEYDLPCGTGDFADSTYPQRLWLLPDSEILVVDNIGVPELDDMLAEADMGG